MITWKCSHLHYGFTEANAWRTWFFRKNLVPKGSTEIQTNFQEMCRNLPLQWPHLNQMAEVALLALKCELLWRKVLFFFFWGGGCLWMECFCWFVFNKLWIFSGFSFFLWAVLDSCCCWWGQFIGISFGGVVSKSGCPIISEARIEFWKS